MRGIRSLALAGLMLFVAAAASPAAAEEARPTWGFGWKTGFRLQDDDKTYNTRTNPQISAKVHYTGVIDFGMIGDRYILNGEASDGFCRSLEAGLAAEDRRAYACQGGHWFAFFESEAAAQADLDERLAKYMRSGGAREGVLITDIGPASGAPAVIRMPEPRSAPAGPKPAARAEGGDAAKAEAAKAEAARAEAARAAAKAEADAERARQDARSEKLNAEVNARNAAVNARNAEAQAAYARALAEHQRAEAARAAVIAQQQAEAAAADARYRRVRAEWEAKAAACKRGDRAACAPVATGQ